MAYCTECGFKNDDADRFCSECGAKLERSVTSTDGGNANANNANVNVNANALDQNKLVGGGKVSKLFSTKVITYVAAGARLALQLAQGIFDVDLGIDFIKSGGSESRELLRGVIMTNISRLAKHFNRQPDEIEILLREYINGLRKLGIDYSLLDLSDRGCGDSWVAHSRELDALRRERFDGYDKPLYLFIVGGDDIVPMPIIENQYYYSRVAAGDSKYSDKDIDTDLPYAYLRGEATIKMLYSGELFNHRPHFCVGRLPFDKSSDVNLLIYYLKRSFEAQMRGGIHIESGYAQSFRTWTNESVMVGTTLNKESILPDYSVKYDQKMACKNILISPSVELKNVQPLFNTKADFLFFNMHGDSNPRDPNFSGDSHGFSPKQLETLEVDNVLITEACYGAKFKGLKADMSMLLTALKNKTLLYFGSSRIALGGGGYSYDRVEDLMSADLYFKYLVDALLLEGAPMGYSVELARVRYIQSRERLDLKDMLTIAEFNLYGDPMIRTQRRASVEQVYAQQSQVTNSSTLAPLAEGRSDCGFEVETLYESQSNSLLSMIRNQVDSSLKGLVDGINQELYARFSVKPRDLSSIAKFTFKDRSSYTELVYSNKDNGRSKVYVVQVEGDKRRILTSK